MLSVSSLKNIISPETLWKSFIHGPQMRYIIYRLCTSLPYKPITTNSHQKSLFRMIAVYSTQLKSQLTPHLSSHIDHSTGTKQMLTVTSERKSRRFSCKNGTSPAYLILFFFVRMARVDFPKQMKAFIKVIYLKITLYQSFDNCPILSFKLEKLNNFKLPCTFPDADLGRQGPKAQQFFGAPSN